MIPVADAAVQALIQRLIIGYSGAVASGAVVGAVVSARRRLARHGQAPSVELLEQVVRRELTDVLAANSRCA